MYDMGEHTYKASAATMPYAAHFMEQNALTDNKQKITKQISRSKKSLSHHLLLVGQPTAYS